MDETGAALSESLWTDEQEKPIQHLRVIDLTVMLPGPYITRILSQYGADVVKIEALPKGDPTRELKDSSLFEFFNQGKRSAAVNLKSPEGVSIVRQLAAEADVFIENFKEGVMERFGLGYADMSEDNPDLIYCSVRGLSGKNSKLASHDLNFIASSGCGEWFLETGVPNYSTQFGDIVGGTLIPTIKLLMHLANPERRGMHLISYMDEGFRALYLPRAYDAIAAEKLPQAQRKNYGTQFFVNGTNPHSRYYKCRDDQWVSLNAIQQKHWDTFCEVVDRAVWKPRIFDVSLCPEVEKLFLDAPSTYWEALSKNRELCLFRVISWEEHISASQARPQLTTDPLSWCGFAPAPGLSKAPTLGADTFAVVQAMGASNKEISDWFQSGVLAQPINSPNSTHKAD